MRVCGRCGATVTGDRCGLCGAPANQAQTLAAVPTSAPPVPAPSLSPTPTTTRPALPLGPSSPDGPGEPGRRRGLPRVGLVIGGAALLVAALVTGWSLGRDEPAVSGYPVAGDAAAVDPADAAATRGGTTPTHLASRYPEVVVPPGSKECGHFGTGPLAAAGTANETTSCPFSLNVHEAYLATGLNGTPGQVTAYSPVTEKWYTLDCSGWQPVLCTGGVAARVILYGGELVVDTAAGQ